MIVIPRANSICKNKFCQRGENNARAHFYACAYCVKSQAWRSVCCSKECYDEYVKQVMEARSQKQSVDLIPDRLDMSKEETLELMKKPYDEIIIQTKKELSDYIEDIESIGIGLTVDKINEEIRNNNFIIEIDTQSEQAEEPINTSRRNRKNKYNS